MRHDVSFDFFIKQYLSKLSESLNIPQHKLEGAIKRRTLQYVDLKPKIFRFDKSFSSIESGSIVFIDSFDVIRGFPKIVRTLMLYPTIKKHFSSCKKVVVEEKMNGYNTRVALIDNKIYGITRGGFICPYTTEKVNELLPKDFFFDNPDLVLCGEMVGPDSPYVPKDIYGIESIEFFLFDIRKKGTGVSISVTERRKLADKYGIKSVKCFGEFNIDTAHIEIANIILKLGDHEGVIIKDPKMILTPIKYTTSQSNCADLKYAFEFYNDYGKDFFFGRVCREAFQSVEFDEDNESLRKRCIQLGESIILPMVKTIEKKMAGEQISENLQIRIKKLNTYYEFKEYLRLLGVYAIFDEPEKINDDEYLVKFKKIYKSTNDKTDSILNGGFW